MKRLALILMLPVISVVIITSCAGCREADRVSQSISRSADNFDVERRLIVINTVNDTVLFTVEGTFSISTSSTNNELVVISKEGEGENAVYRKHFISRPPTVVYIVEDVTGNIVDPTKFKVILNPKMLLPFDIDMNLD